MPKRGSQVMTTAAEFARTGMRYRIEPRFGEPVPQFAPTGKIAAVVVMAHPKRKEHWEKLQAELEGHGFPVAVSVDGGAGILANAANVLTMLGAAKGDPHSWCMVVEDDVVLAKGLPAALAGLLETIPDGVAAFSLHLGKPSRGQGWRYRYRGEVLRTQCAGWRLQCIPMLIDALAEYTRTTPLKRGWDTCCSRALDAAKLQAVFSVPSYVQHDSVAVPSLLGNHMAKAPQFQAVMP
jgi:hypothetical protein